MRAILRGRAVVLALPLLVAGDPCLAHVNTAGGELRAEIDGPAVGAFLLESAGGGDLRQTPGTATLEIHQGADPAGAGEVTGSALRVNEARRVDPGTGRPLPGPIAGSVDAFEAFDGWTIGSWPNLDPDAGWLTIWNSTNQIPGLPVNLSIAELLSDASAGNPGANTLISGGLAGAAVPFVTLNTDPCDGLLADCVTPGPAPSAFLSTTGPTLNQLLTSQQQALLGCGEFYGTNCEAGGVTMLNSEASGWLQCLPDGDPDRDYGDPSVPQPCTVEYQGGPVCTRSANGPTVILPGCRGPGDGYDVDVDGGTAGLIQPFFDPASPYYLGVPSPFSQQFQNEMAALSFNTLMMLAAFSFPVNPSSPAEDEFDASDPYRPDGCSFRKPQLCGNVRFLLGLVATERADDPSGPPRRRWAWETGADYAITSATGSLEDFDGWTFHALGPEVSRSEDAELGVSFVLGPPVEYPPCPGNFLPPVPQSILIVWRAGCDSVLPSSDDHPLGLAYGVVPEPSVLLSGSVALAALAFLARRQKVSPTRGL